MAARPRLENAHGNVQIGKHIQNTTSDRKEKDIPYGDIGVIDWAEFKHGILHETKKGGTPAAADELQIKSYMSWMRNHGIAIQGARIHYPKQKRTTEIPWDDGEVKTGLTEARHILNQPEPPPVIKLPYCKSCAFCEFGDRQNLCCFYEGTVTSAQFVEIKHLMEKVRHPNNHIIFYKIENDRLLEKEELGTGGGHVSNIL